MVNIAMTIAAILMLCGVVFVYDARSICKKEYDIVKQNSEIKKMKVLGLILFLINGVIMMLFI